MFIRRGQVRENYHRKREWVDKVCILDFRRDLALFLTGNTKDENRSQA